MSLREQLKRTVRDLTIALDDLKDDPAARICIDGPAPLVYIPDLAKKPELPLESEEAPVVTPNKDLPPNMACRLCPDRIYAVRRYLIPGTLPALVLRYNYPIDERTTALPDRSDRSLFPTAEEEDLFSRMLGAVQLKTSDLYYQEFPACHFDPRSLPEEFNRRTENCFLHLRQTVAKENIRFLLVTGAAAILMFGDAARQLAETSQIVSVPVTDDLTLPCLVVRSPAALIAMERQRLRAEKALLKFPEHLQRYEKLKSRPEQYRSHMQTILAALPPARPQGERIIANVRLKSASAIQTKGKGDPEEERLRAAGREGDALLWKLLRLRESEVRVKKQIVESLKKMKTHLQA